MSLENDITAIKNIFEAKPMFRPAGEAERANRPKIYRIASWGGDYTTYPMMDAEYSDYLQAKKDAMGLSKRVGCYAVAVLEIGEHGDTMVWSEGDVPNYYQVGAPPVNEATPLFKPAGDAELQTRKEEADERARLEREARQAQVGDLISRIVAMVPGIQMLREKLSDSPIGNHGERDDFDFPAKVSFNIKIYKIDIPQWAREKYEQMGLESTANDDIHQEMQDQLQSFAEGLQEEYSFITDWYQDGRMGGWLSIDVKSVTDMNMLLGADAEHILDDFSDATDVIDLTSEWTTSEFADAERVLVVYGQAIEKRIQDLGIIAKKVERARREVEKMFSSDEYWNDFFERYQEEIEEIERINAKRFFKPANSETIRKRGEG